MNERYDTLIVGSGAGGSAAAYALAHAGRRVLLLEKGQELPRDGSTLDVDKVIRQGIFKSKEHWLDKNGRTFEPEEYFNLGGKTKWYGAALARFEPHEFEAGFLPGALNIPLAQLADRLLELPPLRTPVFVCRSGTRSLAACTLASQAGIQSPAHLAGGLLAWVQEVDDSLFVV